MCRGSIFSAWQRGDFDPEHSEIDFLVELDREHRQTLSFNTCFDFKEALEALLGRTRSISSSLATVRNPYLKASIDASREPVFEA